MSVAVSRLALLGVVLVSLLGPAVFASSTYAPSCDVVLVDQDARADLHGVPLGVVLDIHCPEAVGIRLWLSRGEGVDSDLWDGDGWIDGSRYVGLDRIRTSIDGHRLVALRPDPSADTDAGRQLDLMVTVRDDAAATLTGPVKLGTVEIMPALRYEGRWLETGDLSSPLGAVMGIGATDAPLASTFAWRPVWDDDNATRTSQAAPALLAAIGPDLRDGQEAIRIATPMADTDLAGLRLLDGEGVLVHPRGERSSLDTSWSSDGAAAGPRFPDITTWHETGRFALSNEGDMVWLVHGDTLLDAFAYGEPKPAPEIDPGVLGLPTGIPAGYVVFHGSESWDGEPTEDGLLDGRVYERRQDAPAHGEEALPAGPYATSSAHPWIDTDARADWTMARIVRQEQTDARTGWVTTDGEVRVFVCPDTCLIEVLARIAAAHATIDLWMYDLSLVEAVRGLQNASERGVAVRVWLDGVPVGADSTKRARIAAAIEDLQHAGIEVRIDDRERFDHMHAKAIIVDQAWVVVLSENANLHGWAPDGVNGNRGWGVAVNEPRLARWFSLVFEQDFLHATDSILADPDTIASDRTPLPQITSTPSQGRHDTLVAAGRAVPILPVLSPEHTGDVARHPLLAAIATGEQAVGVQQLNLPLRWARAGYSTSSPFVDALTVHASAGRDVLVDLDDTFLTEGNRYDNDDTVAAVAAATTEGHVAARLGIATRPEQVIHNKGWVIDPEGRGLVMIGSQNGNLASQSLNREIGLIIEDPLIAQHLMAILRDDMGLGNAEGRDSDGGADTTAAVPAPAAVGLILLVAVGVRLLRGPPTAKRP